MRFYCALSTLFFSCLVSSENFGGKDISNGYKLSDYKDFEKTWHLVTVRYRKDTGEQRFTYANDIAWDNLKKNSKDYDDGAIFAKIGIATETDPLFVSSSVPMGARRYQLMVRNKQLHANTAGWGYALFDARGKTMDEDPKIQIQACAACHKLAENRGYVFSLPMELRKSEMDFITKKFQHKEKQISAASPNFKSNINFEVIPKNSLPDSIRKHLPSGIDKIFSVGGPIKKSIFQGTLDEIRPTLSKKAYQENGAAILTSTNFDKYTLVFEDKTDKKCQNEKTNSKSFKVIYTATYVSDKKTETTIQVQNFCYDGN